MTLQWHIIRHHVFLIESPPLMLILDIYINNELYLTENSVTHWIGRKVKKLHAEHLLDKSAVSLSLISIQNNFKKWETAHFIAK